MAHSAIAKTPIGIILYWDKGPQPNMVLKKWFSTAKLAIIAKESLQVDKILRPHPTSAELEYPQEPIYEQKNDRGSKAT